MEKRSIAQVSGSDCEYDVVEGLSSWEFINPSDDEYDAVLALTDTDDDDEHAIGTQLNYLKALKVEIVETQLKSITVHRSINQDLKGFEDKEEEEEEEGGSGNPDYEDDCYYDDDDADDLDDELVPMYVRGKFGKERIKKLGKRSGPRMNKSKKLAYIFNRPGCVSGKHALGVQHSYI